MKFSLFNEDKERFTYEFPVEIETHAHGEVIASCPLLPGARAQGRTEHEALDGLRGWMNRYFLSAAPAPFERTEVFKDHPKIYSLIEYRGHLLASSNRDAVLKSGSGAPGSWKSHLVTNHNASFFNPDPSGLEDSGDYATQIYCLVSYAPLGQESSIFAGTNLNGAVYRSDDGEVWHEAFATGEDRVHCFTVFKDKLYAGTSSEGKVFAYDGAQWNAVGALNEVAVTALGVYQDRLYAGTYPSGLLFSSSNGLAWEETSATGHQFVQCFHEFKGAFYAGCSSPKGVTIMRTRNGRDWETVYESARESNLFCFEVFDGQLWVGSGNSGRVLATRDGDEWRTAFADDDEGVRALTVFNDFLWAATENGGAILKSTHDTAPLPKADKIQTADLTSSTAVITWETDIACDSEVQYAPVAEGDDDKTRQKWPCVFQHHEPTRLHRIKLAGLKAGVRYRYRVVCSNRQSSTTVVEGLEFLTTKVSRPKVDSATHPNNGQWSRSDSPELLVFTDQRVAGFLWCVDREKETRPEKPKAEFTDSNRVAVANLAEGPWWFHVLAVDENGNPGEEAVHYPILVDTRSVPPREVRCLTHPDPSVWVSNNQPVLEWDAPEEYSGVKGYYVKIDRESGTVPDVSNGAFAVVPRFESSPLEDGVWYAHIATADEAGNRAFEAVHRTIRIDTQAAAPSLSSPTHPREDKWYSAKNVRVDWAPPHDLSGIEGYLWVVDQEPKTLPDPSNATFTPQSHIELTDVGEGAWYAHVRTRDKAGNLSTDASHLAVRVDTVADPPAVESPTHIDENRWYNKRRVVVSWKDPADHAGIEGFYYTIDQNPDTVPSSTLGLYTQERSISFELSKDGLWYFHVVSKDKAGNVGKRANHLSLRVDTSVGSPKILSRSHPDGEAWSSEPTAAVQFQPPEDLSGVTAFLYQLTEDESAVFDPTRAQRTLKTNLEVPLPHDGVHYLLAVCEDAAENVSRTASRLKMRLDTAALPPTLSSPTHSVEGQWYGARKFEVVMTDAADLSGVDGYYVAFNRDADWKIDVSAMRYTTARNAGAEATEDGIWWMHVVAKDKAGNLSDPARRAFRVDTAARSAQVNSPTHPPQRWSPEPRAKFTWVAPDELSGVAGYYYCFDRKPHTIPTPETGVWTTETEWTSNPLQDGTWYFHLAVKDRVGNISQGATHCAVQVDAVPPVSKLSPLPEFLDKTRIQLSWESKDDSSGLESYDVQVRENDGAWMEWLSAVTETSAAFQGRDGVTFSFRLRAHDKVGNIEPYQEKGQANATVTIDISAPPSVTELKAQSRPKGAIELNWKHVVDPVSGTAFYRVYRWVEGETHRCVSRDGEVTGETYTDTSEGLRDNVKYSYSVHAVDKLGNEQHEDNATATCLSDHGVGTPVLSSSTHSPDRWSTSRDAMLTWQAPDDASGVEGYYYLLDTKTDSKPNAQNGTMTREKSISFKNLEAGQRWFHLSALDKAGNVGEPAHYTLWVDAESVAVPSVYSSTHADPARWYMPFEARFQITALPKPSGVEAFYYQFDQNPATPVVPGTDGVDTAAPQRITEPEVKVTASQPGRWFLHVAVRDHAGNLSPTAHREILVSGGEVPPPAVHSSSHPKEDEIKTDANPIFTWEDRIDEALAPVGYVYRLSHNANDTLGTQDTFTTERTAKFTDVEDGEWWFHVAGVTAGKKPGVLSARRKITIKRTGKLAGKWISKDGQTPLGGVPVEAWRGEKREAITTTGPDGIFSFDSLLEGRYEIRILQPNEPYLPLKDVPVGPGVPLTPMILSDDAGVFPNPPQPGPMKFYYNLKEDCQMLVEIFDAKGNLIDRLTDKKQGGAYGFTLWDATGKPEGIYQYKLTGKSLTRNALARFTVKKFKLMRLVPKVPAQAKLATEVTPTEKT
jgi:hypothetical protein